MGTCAVTRFRRIPSTIAQMIGPPTGRMSRTGSGDQLNRFLTRLSVCRPHFRHTSGRSPSFARYLSIQTLGIVPLPRWPLEAPSPLLLIMADGARTVHGLLFCTPRAALCIKYARSPSEQPGEV